MKSMFVDVDVVLLNLGGPQSLDEVRPFLQELFEDPQILRIPNPWRKFLSKLISTLRAKKSKGIYQLMGGKSPIIEETKNQTLALQEKLSSFGLSARVHMGMRYGANNLQDVMKILSQVSAKNVVLLPLYPQFSTTTTLSSFLEWKRLTKKNNFSANVSFVCCYPINSGFVDAYVDLARQGICETDNYHILFSAHGLPESVVKEGDPYPEHIELTAKAVAEKLGVLDYCIGYHSKVGPKRWIGPTLEEGLQKIVNLGKVPVIIPISFVSEHSETYVDLDVNAKNYAEKLGLKKFIRIPTVRTHPLFIDGLAHLVIQSLNKGPCIKVCQSSCPLIPSF